MKTEESCMNDVELLSRFVEERSEDAFRSLVERHSKMVYATCLRGLGDAHMAEDASQAVFIALAKRANKIRNRNALPSWLFGTARLTVSHIMREKMRRKRRETAVVEMVQEARISPSEEVQWKEVCEHLNDAIGSLRKRQKDAVVSHFLEGKPQKEVARELGCTEHAIQRRISRGLGKLCGKLSKKGVVLSVVTLTGFLATKAAHAAPVGLVASCHAAAMATLSGNIAAFGGVTLIAKGAMKMMMLSKIKIVTTYVVATIIVGGIVTPLAIKGFAQGEGSVAEKSDINILPKKTEKSNFSALNENKIENKRVTISSDGRATKDGKIAISPDQTTVVNGGITFSPVKKEKDHSMIMQKISIKSSEMRFDSSIKWLQEMTGVNIKFADKKLEKSVSGIPMTIDIENKTFKEALKSILKDVGLDYKVIDGNIVLFRRVERKIKK